MKPFQERYCPGLQAIKQRGDKRTPSHRFTAILKTKMDARGNTTSVRLRDIKVFADLTLGWLRNPKIWIRIIHVVLLVSFTQFSFHHDRIFLLIYLAINCVQFSHWNQWKKKKMEDFPRKFEVLCSGIFCLSFLIRLLRFNYKIANIIIITKNKLRKWRVRCQLDLPSQAKSASRWDWGEKKRGTVHFPRGTSRHSAAFNDSKWLGTVSKAWKQALFLVV